jgi:glucuronoarabinoxylan endo-1,4-beta-xylanase
MKNNFSLFFLFIVLSPALPQDIPVTVNQDIVFQTIEGFGGFGAKKVWWDSPPYYDQGYLNQVIDSLGCTFIRTQIYWDAEPVNDNSDPNSTDWSKFNFGPETDNGKQFSFIHDLNLKGARLLATVWTPPLWMKGLDEFYGTLWGNPVRRRPSDADLNANCAWCGGAAGCEQVGGWLKSQYYSEFAEYLVAYVKKVKEQTGVDVWAINIQNEPYFANPFESCVVIPSEYADILKTVGERFAEEGITTRLFGPEHMGEVTWGVNTEYIKEILEDETVKPYLSFYAVHSYVDGVAPDYGSAEGWSALYEKVVTTHGKELWMTETSDFDKQGYDLAISMAKSLYLGLKFGHISGWVYWAMADYIIKNNKLTPLGRGFQQYYRFLLPGTQMIEVSSADPDILVVAGKLRDNLSIIAINNSAVDKSISFEGPGIPAEFKMFRTSATENFKRLPVTGSTGIIFKAESITSISSGDLPTGNQKVISPDGIEILPNPVTDYFCVKNADDCLLTLHDYMGRCLIRQYLSASEQFIETGSIPAGMYVLTIKGTGRCLTQKMIIQKNL